MTDDSDKVDVFDNVHLWQLLPVPVCDQLNDFVCCASELDVLQLLLLSHVSHYAQRTFAINTYSNKPICISAVAQWRRDAMARGSQYRLIKQEFDPCAACMGLRTFQMWQYVLRTQFTVYLCIPELLHCICPFPDVYVVTICLWNTEVSYAA